MNPHVLLRTRAIGTLSNYARSFILSGSRCNAADGTSSCTSTEDDHYVSRKQQTSNNGFFLSTKISTLPSKSSQKVTPFITDKTSDSQGSEVLNYSTSVHQSNTNQFSSQVIADQFMKVGVAAVGFVSDLVNYKMPIFDVTGILGFPHNYMVNPRAAPPSNVRSADHHVKASKRESFSKVNRKPSVETTSAGVKSSKNYPIKSDKPRSVSKASFESFSRDEDKRRPVPQGWKTNNFIPNCHSSVQSLDVKTVHRITEMPLRFAKMVNRRCTNTKHAQVQVVESVSHILQNSKWGHSTEEALGKLNCSFDAYQANQILKQLKDHSVALGFFYWLRRQPGFKHDEHTYTTMVGILGRSRQFGAINKLLAQMETDSCRPNVVTYNRMIHSYGRANFLNEALNLFNQMVDSGCSPDRVTYCTLIDIHAKAGFLDVSLFMYQKMQQAGLSPDTFTYSLIINCLGKAGHLNAAHKLFTEMVDQGCIPNLVTYNIMIALQAKARNYPSALQLYRDMKCAGFEPDKVTYSIVMEVLGHCGYLEEAEAVFREMKWKKWVPDEPVYGLLVDLWGKAGNVEKAWDWYRAMFDAGLRPNVPTCNSLLSAFLRVHRLVDAYNLLQSMAGLGLSPSLQTYTLLLSCCTEARAQSELGYCYQLMALTAHPAHSFLLSMPDAGPDGVNVRNHTSGFLDLMHSEDRESKRGMVDALVDFLHRSGLKEEAGSVWEVAAERNVYPDALKEKSSSYWLINLHVMSEGTAVTAMSRSLTWLKKRMILKGICPERIDIVTGWGRRSRVTGTSLVRRAVEEVLYLFRFPFAVENCNSGCFVGCGESLGNWLAAAYVERMHLL